MPAPLIVCGLIDIYRPTMFAVNRRRETDPRVTFGKVIRQLRLSKKLSQEDLADLAEIHRTYIGDVERGTRNISLVNMSRIANALGVPLSRVFSDMEQDA
jgi:DNA-binding XRE family transcriptional regulator